jgi:hypothetical protein
VGALIKQRFSLALSVWTVGRYLRCWGLTPQKPARRAYEQDPEAVRRWLEVEYPEIRKQPIPRGGDSLGRRDGGALGPSGGAHLEPEGAGARGSWHWAALPVQRHIQLD